ncbi:hypothetical protein CQA53_06780 [Helicobacter didelphidarum]|uniref:Uncharacterized protein n=1 Tax=Helicobacter didelphidarum TaxID=2040648 RepID=A0A3D8IKV5_9HELI|nr:hypothetical protein [Helicobacter didelphidarum]RDU65274.1 hypothetical protein CQA53_06780 [Helicobacter didelphidarum]
MNGTIPQGYKHTELGILPHPPIRHTERSEVSTPAVIACEAKQSASFVIARNEMTKQSINEAFKEDSMSEMVNVDYHAKPCGLSRNDNLSCHTESFR